MSLRTSLNKILRKYGYEITKFHRFGHFMNKTFVERSDFHFVQIGANDGTSFDDLFSFVVVRNSKGLVVEPLSFYYTQLEKNYQNFPSVIPINCAIHKYDTEAVMYHVDPKKLNLLAPDVRGIGSLDPSHHNKSGVLSDYMIEEKVQCMHFMDLIKKYNFFDIDLLQIDVEGYDKEVIEMIDFAQVKPKCIKYEHRSLSPEDHEWVQGKLKQQGYHSFEQGSDSIAIISTLSE